jgi:hypothetical protein
MHLLATSAHATMADPVARVLGVAGVVLALASLLLAWHQWRRSGASLKVVISAREGRPDSDRHGQAELWVISVDVLNTGRMPAVVRDITVVQLASRWALTSVVYVLPKLLGRALAFSKDAKPVYGEYPQMIPPTGYIQAEATLDADVMDASSRWLRAMVWRGDGRTIKSPVIFTPRDEPLPRALRKMRQASAPITAGDDK